MDENETVSRTSARLTFVFMLLMGLLAWVVVQVVLALIVGRPPAGGRASPFQASSTPSSSALSRLCCTAGTGHRLKSPVRHWGSPRRGERSSCRGRRSSRRQSAVLAHSPSSRSLCAQERSRRPPRRFVHGSVPVSLSTRSTSDCFGLRRAPCVPNLPATCRRSPPAADFRSRSHADEPANTGSGPPPCFAGHCTRRARSTMGRMSSVTNDALLDMRKSSGYRAGIWLAPARRCRRSGCSIING